MNEVKAIIGLEQGEYIEELVIEEAQNLDDFIGCICDYNEEGLPCSTEMPFRTVKDDYNTALCCYTLLGNLYPLKAPRETEDCLVQAQVWMLSLMDGLKDILEANTQCQK